MTSIAPTARICASAPEAAFLVASFISLSHHPGSPIQACVVVACEGFVAHRNVTQTPHRRVFASILSPHSANIDDVRIEY